VDRLQLLGIIPTIDIRIKGREKKLATFHRKILGPWAGLGSNEFFAQRVLLCLGI